MLIDFEKAIQNILLLAHKRSSINTTTCLNTLIALKFCIVLANYIILCLGSLAVTKVYELNSKFWGAQAE